MRCCKLAPPRDHTEIRKPIAAQIYWQLIPTISDKQVSNECRPSCPTCLSYRARRYVDTSKMDNSIGFPLSAKSCCRACLWVATPTTIITRPIDRDSARECIRHNYNRISRDVRPPIPYNGAEEA